MFTYNKFNAEINEMQVTPLPFTRKRIFLLYNVLSSHMWARIHIFIIECVCDFTVTRLHASEDRCNPVSSWVTIWPQRPVGLLLHRARPRSVKGRQSPFSLHDLRENSRRDCRRPTIILEVGRAIGQFVNKLRLGGYIHRNNSTLLTRRVVVN